jgi:hypothetical protein
MNAAKADVKAKIGLWRFPSGISIPSNGSQRVKSKIATNVWQVTVENRRLRELCRKRTVAPANLR